MEVPDGCYVDEQGSIADITKCGPDEWLLTRINVKRENRGLGLGRALIKQVLEDMDEVGGTLYVQPASSAHGRGLSQYQLEQWYTRLGFEWDPDVPGQMVRRPS